MQFFRFIAILITFSFSSQFVYGQCQIDEMLDCNGNCAPVDWLGDGTCDSGGRYYKGNYIDFGCVLDGGDCVLDCDGDGAPASWVGDGNCDSGGRYYQGSYIDLDCIAHNIDGGDCVLDCDGDGAPATWVGDGNCDSGGRYYQGSYINLDCLTHNIDGGDCVLDCDGDGAPATWVGDGICDSGGRYYQGSYIDLACLTHDIDGGDCVLDCDGDGAPATWVGDSYCDSGGRYYQGSYIDLACLTHNIDGGDCVLDCDGDGAPAAWVGDGTCDDGDRYYQGSYIHLRCLAGGWDGGDCGDPVGSEPLPPNKWTIIIHGWKPSGGSYSTLTSSSGWMMQLAKRMKSIGSTGVTIHRMNLDTFSIDPIAPFSSSKHHVLLFNWTKTSGLETQLLTPADDNDGYAYAAADALYAFLRTHGINGRVYAMFGHSRGAVVSSELAKRLILDQAPPHQVVYIDGEGKDLVYADSQFDAWQNADNIRFDNIYQSTNWLLPPYFHLGHEHLPKCRNLDVGDDYTHGSIHNYLIQNLVHTDGYFRLPGDWTEVEDTDAPIPVASSPLYNGDFNWNSRAGWKSHGGGGNGYIAGIGNHYVQLTRYTPWLLHSWFWLGSNYTRIQFTLRATDAESAPCNDALVVSLQRVDGVSRVLKTIPICNTIAPTTYNPKLPEGYAGHVCRLQFALTGGSAIHSIVDIDSVTFTSPAPLTALASPACGFDLTTDDVVDLNDLVALLGKWGQCVDASDCSADITGNGLVDIDDLVQVITNWGPCP